jgi:DNA-binding transcriptional regulator YiaG
MLYRHGMSSTTLTTRQAAQLREWLESGSALEIRERARLPRSRAARQLGVLDVTLYRWEHGMRTPRGRHARAYLKLLTRLAERSAA